MNFDDFDDEFDRQTWRQVVVACGKVLVFGVFGLGALILTVYVLWLASGAAG